MNPADISASALPLTSSDLSLWHLFWQAHWLVKTVMTGLIVCSVWVWAIAIDKTFMFSRIRRSADGFEAAFWSGQSLEELYTSLAARPGHSTGALFVAAMREWKRSFEGHARSFAGLQMRIEKVMNVAIAREVEHMERWLPVLATVGSAGPFVGLFGTIWGIMTSFQSIAASKNTSLAVVAPGIAEALFATAIGLIAAIPATIFYNRVSSEVNRQAQRLEGFADEFSAILSRQIDERGRGDHMAASVVSASSGGRKRGRRRAVMSEINVTPFVDVMLVLLIVFMVSAPLLTVGVPLDLPQSQAKSLDQDREPLTVSVNVKGQVFLQNSEIKIEELVPKLKAITDARGGGFDERVYVRGDKKVDYGTMMRVMGRLSAAGYHRVALVTEVEQGGG
jgi:biopolymer transport protein TolQ